MSNTITVVVSHHLGKVEAARRLKDGLAHTKGHLGALIAVEQETWEGDTLRFRMRALGQTAAASIEVLEDALHIEVSLPWRLANAAALDGVCEWSAFNLFVQSAKYRYLPTPRREEVASACG
jgi:putative polyhydroxyalkanoic acid system protein